MGQVRLRFDVAVASQDSVLRFLAESQHGGVSIAQDARAAETNCDRHCNLQLLARYRVQVEQYAVILADRNEIVREAKEEAGLPEGPMPVETD